MRSGLGLCIALVLLVSCKSNKVSKREACLRVGNHVTEIVFVGLLANPDQFWDLIHTESGDPGIPATTTKETFAQFLASGEGQTWVTQRRVVAGRGAQKIADQCMKKMTPKQIQCVLVAMNQPAIAACDLPK